MSARNFCIVARTIPVFFIVECSSLFDLGDEIFTKKVELFEEGNSIFALDSRDPHIPYGQEDRHHEDAKNCHTHHELKEGKSMSILLFHAYFLVKDLERRGIELVQKKLVQDGFMLVVSKKTLVLILIKNQEIQIPFLIRRFFLKGAV